MMKMIIFNIKTLTMNYWIETTIKRWNPLSLIVSAQLGNNRVWVASVAVFRDLWKVTRPIFNLLQIPFQAPISKEPKPTHPKRRVRSNQNSKHLLKVVVQAREEDNMEKLRIISTTPSKVKNLVFQNLFKKKESLVMIGKLLFRLKEERKGKKGILRSKRAWSKNTNLMEGMEEADKIQILKRLIHRVMLKKIKSQHQVKMMGRIEKWRKKKKKQKSSNRLNNDWIIH